MTTLIDLRATDELLPTSDVADASAEGSADDSEFATHRALALVAAAGLLIPADLAWSAFSGNPAFAVLGAAVTGVALLLICLVASASSVARLERLDWWLLAAGIAGVILAVAGTSKGMSSYASDEAALIHGGAVSLLHGHDPYAANLSWAFQRYGLTGRTPLTYLMNGGAAHTLDYPALPLLAALPIVAISHDGSALTIVAAAGLCVAMAATFMVLPKQFRIVAVIVCAETTALLALAEDGLPSMLMLGALTVCFYRWASVGRRNASGNAKLGTGGNLRAICLGLALATNQLAWFLAPFLLVGTYLAARNRLGGESARRITAGYLVVAVAAFVVVNAPFFFWGPHQWLADVATPITQHAIPWGQGLVGLTTFARIGGGALSFYNYGSALLYLALLCIFWRRFEQLGRCLVLFPLVAIYTSGRPLDSYWLAPIGVVVVSVVCSGLAERAAPQRIAPATSKGSKHRLPAPVRYGSLFVPALICFVVALTTPGPLTLQVLGSRISHGHNVSRLVIVARNSSGHTLDPHFAINNTGTIAGIWHTVSGPARLRPGATARYVIDAPDVAAQPPAGTSYILQAISDTPETISSSALVSAPKR
jgi:uncharacterized membrane protein